MLRAFGISDKGRTRPTNEDCFAIDAALGLCVVADGMGGHNAGEVAARMAVDAVIDYCRFGTVDWPFGFDDTASVDANVLRTAIHLAGLRILEAAVSASTYAGMGTTIVAARAAEGRLVVAHAGDSRLYRLGRSGLRQLTNDDSWVETVLARDPGVDRAALMHHPMRGALTNVVGARGRTDVHVVEEPIEAGDLILLTTDGVHGVVDAPALERLLRDDADPKSIAAAVIASALAHGSRDNVTAVVARIDEPTRDEPTRDEPTRD